MALRVGVDAANLLRDRRGIGRYVTWLLRAWTERFPHRIEPVLIMPLALWRTRQRRAVAARLGIEAPPIAGRASRVARGLAVQWYPWNGMTWESAPPAVVTVHDLWPFVAPADDARRRRREQSHYRLAAQRARRFIAVSRFTARELTEYLAVDADRIDVIPHGVAPLDGRAPELPAEPAPKLSPYVLFVGEAEPRKDLDTLLAALRLLPEGVRRNTRLVVAGKRPPHTDAVVPEMGIEWLGHVPDERLAQLYAGAAAFVMPSRHEGFGLPVLEAMTYGAPVIASAAAALPEAGGDAALYFAAGDAAALSLTLARVLTDGELAARLSDDGRRRAAVMTIDRCAKRTIEVFERAAEG